MKNNNYKPLIVANWKMNQTTSSAENLLNELLSYDITYDNIIICPPFTLLNFLSTKLKKTSIKLGAQDCSAFNAKNGAFTGDVSSEMLADLNCKYVIIGHSERRKYYLESNDIIKRKIINAHEAGLIAILCIGENLKEREEGNHQQIIAKTLAECLPNCANASNTIIAYEPIWAIGTGKTATQQQIQEMHEFLNKQLAETFEQNIKIIYGGSVNEENSASILSTPYVSGLLIGGASLDSKKFYQIIKNI